MCQQHLSPLPCAFTCCPFVWSGAHYSAKLSSCLSFLNSFLLLATKISSALWKDPQALFCSLLPKDSFPVLLTNSFEELRYCFLKIQGTFFLHLIHIPQDCKFHRCAITSAQGVFSFDATDELTCIDDHQLR